MCKFYVGQKVKVIGGCLVGAKGIVELWGENHNEYKVRLASGDSGWFTPQSLKTLEEGTKDKPSTAKVRKGQPLASGVLAYFPDALTAVAEVSRTGNDQHNPGQPLHWAKGKSTDHADCILRHLRDHLKGVHFDTEPDGTQTRHLAKAAWRALALLQLSIEAEESK